MSGGGGAEVTCQQQQVMSSGCQVSQVMMSEQVMSSGVCVVEVWVEMLSCGQVEVKAELSDGSFLQLNRTEEDLAQMMKMLVDGFLDEGETLSSNLLTGLLRVQAADLSSDPEVKTVEVNKLLKTINHLPHKFSQSEAVLDFFEPSAVDRTFRQEDQDLSVFQNPVVLSDPEIMRSNGFCLANTETILFDLTPPIHHVSQSEELSGRRASVCPAVCLQLCRPSVSTHLPCGFNGLMGRLVKRWSFRHRPVPPPYLTSSTCCSTGLRRRMSCTE